MADEPRERLTAKQKQFVREYCLDRNAVQAYFRAFGLYVVRGGRRQHRTYGGAAKASQRLLQNDAIRAEIEAGLAAVAEQTQATLERIVAGWAAEAFADPADVYEPDPANNGLPMPRPWNDIPPAVRRTIQAVKIKRRKLKGAGDEAWEIEDIEYKFADRQAAKARLYDHLHGVLPGEHGTAPSPDALGLVAALLNGRPPVAGGGGGPAGGDPGGAAVDAEPRPAE